MTPSRLRLTLEGLRAWAAPGWLRRRRLVVGGLSVALVLALLPVAWWRWWGPERFEPIEFGRVPAPYTGTLGEPDVVVDTVEAPLLLGEDVSVFLIFATGSSGMSRADAQRLRVDDLEARGGDRLTDSMMVVLVDPPTRDAAILSIPRDLWVFERGHRINETFARHGAQAFVDDVQQVLGLPVHHLVQVNFVAFANLVDAIGGVALAVDRPLADLHSTLFVPGAGCWRFGGVDALAYARSRHTLTRRGGGWATDTSASDFHRTRRQRELLAAAWDQLRGPQLIPRIPDLLRAASSGLRIDDELGVGDLTDLVRAFSDVAAGGVESYLLPTRGRRINRAAAQVLDARAATPMLARLRSWPPSQPPPVVAAPEESPPPASPPASPAPTSPSPATSPEPPSSPSPSPAASPEPPSSPSPTPVPELSPRTLPTQPATCTRGTAQSLPDPRLALLEVATGHRGAPQPTTDPDPQPDPEPDPDPDPEPDPGDDPGDPDPGGDLPLPELPVPPPPPGD